MCTLLYDMIHIIYDRCICPLVKVVLSKLDNPAHCNLDKIQSFLFPAPHNVDSSSSYLLLN